MLSDEALFERLLGGDLAAFDALYERYERPLFGFILRHTSDRAEAEDLLHEAFIALLRQGRQGRAVAGFRAWIYQVTRNLCHNRQRSGRRAARALAAAAQQPAPPGPQPERALEQRQTTEALRRAVARLPRRLGELYQLRTGGLSYQELSEVLEVPLGTVKSRMNEMVRRLQQEMQR